MPAFDHNARTIVETHTGARKDWVAPEAYDELVESIASEMRTIAAAELEWAAHVIENVAHSCMTDKHCDFLHAAHSSAAAKLRARAEELRAPRPKGGVA